MPRVAVVLVWWGLLAIGAGVACAGSLVVAVSVPPQAYFVRQVGGERVDVVIAAPPGSSPHAFDPSPSQVARLSAARLYVATGVEIEVQLLPRLRDTCPGLEIIGPRPSQGSDHGHETDPHIWLDPKRASEQAQLIADALAILDPDHAADYLARADDLTARLDTLDAELTAILAPVRGRDLVVAHPAFGHFASAYGLHQVAVEVGGHEPSPRRLAELLERVGSRGSRVLFIQPQFPLAAAKRMETAAGLRLEILDPLAEDYMQNMRAMARTILDALGDR